MSKRPAEPQILIDYREKLNHPMPRCCHTCLQYTPAGVCDEFGVRPPDEFTGAIGQCDFWVEEIPF